MCHASAKSRETKIQRMYVESSETMSVKKMEFVKSSESVNSPSESCSCTDLTVMKTEANVRYLVKRFSITTQAGFFGRTYTMSTVQNMTIVM
jgi:hypothetical protein